MIVRPHNHCPVCGNIFCHSAKYLQTKCYVLNNKKLSFVEYICDGIRDTFTQHVFFQIISLYDDLYYECVSLPENNIEVAVDYVNNITFLIYLRNKTPANRSETMELKNTIIELDYPKLEKVIQKVNTYKPFL